MRRALHSPSMFAILLGALAASALQAADCLVYPLGAPYGFGLHEVYKGQLFDRLNTNDLQDVVWLADGRAAVGYTGVSDFYPQGGVIRITEVVRDEIDFDTNLHIEPPPEARDYNSFFGSALATSGDFIATRFRSIATESVPADTNVLAIYKKGETGHYALDAIIHSPEPDADGGFGGRFAMAGDWLAALDGADAGPRDMRMFRRDETGAWSLAQTIRLPSTADGLNAQSLPVDMDGDRMAIGQYSGGNSSFTGRVYIWRLAEGVWTQEVTLSGPSAGSRFGRSVDLADGLLFVGAVEDDRFGSNHGSVSEYRLEAGEWEFQGAISLPEPQANELLGTELSYSEAGGYLGVVCASGARRGFHLFQRDGGGWAYRGHNGGGNLFEDWESPAGTVKDYTVGKLNSPAGRPIQRGARALVVFEGRVSIVEYGRHRIRTRRVAPMDDCVWHPIGYYGNGGLGSDDSDGDGRSDLEEIYFGGLVDTPSLAAGISFNTISERALEDRSVSFRWLRAPGIDGLIRAEPQWSVNMIVWSGEGLVVEKIGEDPDTGHDIMEATLLEPPEGATVYFRLRFELIDG